jgi:hypothetical protein
MIQNGALKALTAVQAMTSFCALTSAVPKTEAAAMRKRIHRWILVIIPLLQHSSIPIPKSRIRSSRGCQVEEHFP